MSDEEKFVEVVKNLVQIGWSVAIINNPKEKEVFGFIAGTKEFIKEVIEGVPNGTPFTVVSKDEEKEYYGWRRQGH